jgi:hypothetical protein
MSKNMDLSWKIAKEITEIAVGNFEIKGEPRQFTSSIAPSISNAIFNREKELLQEERLLTIIKLSKTVENEDSILHIIKGLGYELTAKKL